MTDKTPAPQVWPALRARDARALIKFLVDAFGFEQTAVYGEGDRVDHAELAWPPGGGIMLAPPGKPTPTTTGRSGRAASAATWLPASPAPCSRARRRPGRRC
ncbi:MAG: hypothetical protein ACLQFR_28135 [Streptosporangiaceae bacterium]